MKNYILFAAAIFSFSSSFAKAETCSIAEISGIRPDVLGRTIFKDTNKVPVGWWQVRAEYNTSGQYLGDVFEVQEANASNPHTVLGSRRASLVNGGVEFFRDPKNNAGFFTVSGRQGYRGGTYGFYVESQADVDQGKSSRAVGAFVSSDAKTMEFHFPHPDPSQDELIKPMQVSSDGSMQINRILSGKSEPSFVVTSNGQAGVGTADPRAHLDVNGMVKLAKNAAAPRSCRETSKGAMALTTKYAVCVCNGIRWIQLNGGGAVCSW
jgi:hypothetical protein